MSSSECYAMAQAYLALKGKLQAIYGPIDTCVSTIGKSELDFENTVLSGKPIDEGKMSESKGLIGNISDDVGVMVAECIKRYNEWMDAYYAALAREREAARKKQTSE